MTLRDYLFEVGSTYDRADGTGSVAAKLLRAAPASFEPHVPAGYLVKGSAGNGAGAFVPWVAFFDPDETTSAIRGMYVVYLFAENMKTVSLSLNQGVTELQTAFGASKAQDLLRNEAAAIRDSFSPESAEGLTTSINLGGRAGLPRAYEAGNIVAKVYDIDSLPGEAELKADLRRMIALYQDALVQREDLRSTTRDVITTIKQTDTQPRDPDPLLHFTPKTTGRRWLWSLPWPRMPSF